MNLLIKNIKILWKIVFVGKAVLHQKLFIKKHFIPQIRPFFKNADQTLTETDYNKITKYYGLIVPSILGELLCLLRGKKMSFVERKYGTYQSSLTGLVDDFFDVHDFTLEEVKKIVSFQKRPITSTEQLSTFLHRESIDFYSYNFV